MTRRLFFAFWPSDSLREQIGLAAAEVVRESGGRPIPAHNLHVTLLFLGEVPAAALADVIAAAAATPGSGFELQLDRLEIWPQPRVLVLSAVQTPPALASLVDDLRISLLQRQVTLKREDRYRPHLTLARHVSQRGPLPLPQTLHWRVTDFVLVDSQVTSAGSLYSVIGRWPLA